MKKPFSFNKTERLKSRKVLEQLFSKGNTFLVHPFKVMYMINSANEAAIHCGVGVSKKNFSKAVQRNRVKRLMREVYRLNKQPIYDVVKQHQVNLFILYIDKNMPIDFNYLNSKMKAVVEKMQINYLHEVAQ